MTAGFDLIVLGTGSAGTLIAQRCRAEGWRVAIVDERPFGGTCALRGCEPKKVLWTVAEAADRARRLTEAGLPTGADMRIDWPTLMAFKRSFTDPVPDERSESLKEAGVATYSGTARFAAPDRIAVDGQELSARYIVIATGAMPAPLPIPGMEHVITSDDFLELDRLPPSILLLGGGYISFEFAHIAVRAGAQVTLVQKDEVPLKGFDRDLVGALVEHSRKSGIDLRLGARIVRIERDARRRCAVLTEDGERFEADVAVHGLGRVPNIDRLALEAGEVESEDGRLNLDHHLRSVSNHRVFAAGDAAAVGPPLTPVSTYDADCVVRNLLEGCGHEPDYLGVASAVFTIPPLAKVGLTEEEARAQGRAVEAKHGSMSDYRSVRREGFEDAGPAFKIILDRENDTILGAHLYAPNAHELINLFAMAIRHGLGAPDLRHLLSAYPSEASNIGSMLD